MSIGTSGRIVIEVEPEAKRLLYAALARDGLTLKDWFLRSAENYLADVNQLSLAFSQTKTSLSSDGTHEYSKGLISEGKV